MEASLILRKSLGPSWIKNLEHKTLVSPKQEFKVEKSML